MSIDDGDVVEEIGKLLDEVGETGFRNPAEQSIDNVEECNPRLMLRLIRKYKFVKR